MFQQLLCLVVLIFLTSTQGIPQNFGSLTNRLISGFAPRTEGNDVTSCYTGAVIDGAKDVRKFPCVGPNSVCMTIREVATIEGRSTKISEYLCGIANVCIPLAEASICEKIKAKWPYPLTDCKVQCCRTNNCNDPDQGGVESEREKHLSFNGPFGGRQF